MMIHTVQLSEITLKRLKDIVALQMCLLRYALFIPNVGRDSCAVYLNRYERFRPRGKEIAKWIFDGRAPKRHKPLENFAAYAQLDSGRHVNELRQWCKQLHQQVCALMLNTPLQIEKLYEKDVAPRWQKEAAEFLNHFYEDLQNDANFPAYIFSEPNATKFGRQEFLKEFIKANKDLYVCAICDESGYYTVVDRDIRSEIDHYLPKSTYPHLSCHPYNLIPICKACNQSIKGFKDPLKAPNGERFTLHEIYLPYRSKGLATRTYLSIRFEQAKQLTDWVQIEELLPQNSNDSTVTQLTQVMEEVYKIPHRWSQEGRVDKISETLFRRIRQFIGEGKDGPLGFNMPSAVYNTLNQLLYYLYHEDQGKDPFAVAMTWMLVALLNEEYKLRSQEMGTEVRLQRDSPRFALIAELVEGIGQNTDLNAERANFAKKLQDLARNPRHL